MEKTFAKENTNCVKGIAVLLLFVHHVLNTKYPYESILIGDTFDYLSPLVSLSKVCVYIFFLMSGYGLFLSFSKEEHTLKSACKFVIRHIIRLWSMFWIIYIIFVPMGILFGRSPNIVYADDMTNMIWDFFGLSYLTNHISSLPTWWYLSMTILFYVLFPVIYFIISKLKNLSWIVWGIIALLAVKYIGWRVALIYCVPFILGALLASCNGFERIRILSESIIRNRYIRFFAWLFMIFICCILRLKIMSNDMFFYRLDWILALLIVCFAYGYIPVEGRISKGLGVLGKNSGNIYLFHAFIYSLYFSEFVYGFKYAGLVYIVALVVCLIISEVLEFLKTVTGYNKLFSNINQKFS